MGGKSSTSTSSVAIPPEVLARYNAVNARAETAAANPFQNYTGQFVAGLTNEQQAGVNQASTSAQTAQPYYQAAAGLTAGAAKDVGALTPGQINQYQNPYTQAVVDPTLKALQQQQGQQLSDQQSQAIKSGAGFGERANISRAQLQGQQGLATAQAIAPLYQQGYQQATQTAMGQQGVVASDLARQMQAGQQLAGLGTGAQQAGIQGAQALLAAGTVGQQTQQADLTAKYQQFLQQQGYPFQTAQFLANIAMGTGALSGSTTSTTQPAPFFSDERLKHDAKRIGETDDGLPIYSYKYNGDDRTQIGLMAQDVEKKKPEAVGLAPASDGHMYKTVDYAKATRAKKYAGGGLMPVDNSMGGAVSPMSMGEAFARGGYAYGGPSILSSVDHKALMAANVDPEAGPYAEHGIYKTPRNVIPGLGGSKINMGKGAPPPSLVTANPAGGSTANQIGLGAQALNGLQMVNTGKEAFGTGKGLLLGSAPTQSDPEGARGLIGGQGKMSGTNIFQSLMGSDKEEADGGLVTQRHGYDLGGSTGSDTKEVDDGEDSGVVIPGQKGGIPVGAGLKAAKLAVAGSPSGGGQQRGPGNDMLSALALGKGAFDLGKGAMSLFGGAGGAGVGEALLAAPFGFANGGLVPREHHDGSEGNVVGPAGTGLGTLGDLRAIADETPTENSNMVATVRDEAPEKGSMSDIITRHATNNNVDPALAMKIAGKESRGKQNAQADSSTAGGLFGIIDDTYHGFGGKPGLKYDPEENARVGTKVIAYNQAALQKAGFEPTHGNTYLAHFFGPAGATSVMRNPDRPISETLSNYDAAAEANPFIADWTGKDAMNWANAKMGEGKFEAPSRGLGGLMPTLGRSGPGMYSGKEASQASLGDVVGEFLPKSVPGGSNFWVPALSGLGSMLSSKSHTLAGAVGEGLVGGVSGYQAQKKQEQETVKNIFDMVKDRFTQIQDLDPKSPTYGQIVFRDKYGTSGTVSPGQVQASVAKLLTDAGIDPAPYGLGRTQTANASNVGASAAPRQLTDAGTQTAAGAQPVAKTEAGTVAPAQNTIDAKVQSIPSKPKEEWNPGDYEKDMYRNPENYNIKRGSPEDPNVRLAKIRAMREEASMIARGQLTGSPARASEMEHNAKDEEASLKADMKKAYEGDYATALESRKVGAQKSTEAIEAYRNASGAFLDTFPKQEAALMEVAQLQGQGLKTGLTIEQQAAFKSALRNLGFSDDMFISRNLADPTQVQYLSKIAAASIAESIAANNTQRAPASMSALFKKFSPDPSIDTGAIHLLLGQTLGDLRYHKDRAQDYVDNHKGEDQNKFSSDYLRESSKQDLYNKTMAKAYSDLYLPSGEPDTARKLATSLKERFGDSYSPKIMQRSAPGGGPKTETPAAPVIPAVADRVMDQVYPTPKGNFRWKGTGWERAQ